MNCRNNGRKNADSKENSGKNKRIVNEIWTETNGLCYNWFDIRMLVTGRRRISKELFDGSKRSPYFSIPKKVR